MLFQLDSKRPRRAFSDTKLLQHVAIDSTKDPAHEVDGIPCHEIRSVDLHAGDSRREKTRTINVPNVVGGGRASNERWPMSKATAATMYHRSVEVPAGLGATPVVLVDAESSDPAVSSVVPDEVAGAVTAVGELLEHGHRRIGFINNSEPVLATSGRLEGYQAALKQAEIGLDPTLIVAAPQMAVAAATVASVATLVRVGAGLVQAAVGRDIGLYRTSFLAFEQFGLGRQPREGLREAQGIEFAYEILPA